MYYRNKNIERQKKNTEVLKFSSAVEQNLKVLLNNSKSFYNSISHESLESEPCSKYHKIHDTQFKRKFLDIVYGDIQHNLARAMNIKSKLERNSDMDKILQNEYKGMQNQDIYQNMLKFRSKLPAYKKKSEILQLIDDNQVVVISGETGMLEKLFVNVGYYFFYLYFFKELKKIYFKH